ncbi:MAG: aminoglycoside phosphotransferase family protein [Acidimicrobiia bacterium]
MVVVESLPMPRDLLAASRSDEDGARRAWVAKLPTTVRHLEEYWSLELGDPFQPGGLASWVAPVRNAGNADLVLKVAWRHTEASNEADALRLWAGQGAVRLYASKELEDTIALLVERCVPGTSLASSRPEAEQDSVIASMLLRLWREEVPDGQFRPLQQMCDEWADEFEVKAAAQPAKVDPGLSREGIRLFRTLPATAERTVLLCTDLHAGNVLSAKREPWLAIDPKPYVGDPTYDALQHLLNCDERLRANPHDLARRMADMLGVEYERLLLWLFARCVQESVDWPTLEDVARRVAPA